MSPFYFRVFTLHYAPAPGADPILVQPTQLVLGSAPATALIKVSVFD